MKVLIESVGCCSEALNLIGQTKILPMTPQEFSRYEMKLRKTLKGEDK